MKKAEVSGGEARKSAGKAEEARSIPGEFAKGLSSGISTVFRNRRCEHLYLSLSLFQYQSPVLIRGVHAPKNLRG